MSEGNPVGKTKSQGWEIGVRRTLPIRTDHAWNLLTTQPGLGLWLGHGITADSLRKGARLTTAEGTQVEIRSYAEGTLIRMRWRPATWDFESVLQVRVLPAKTGATFSFHHEHLQNGSQREQMRQHWAGVMDALAAFVEGHA